MSNHQDSITELRHELANASKRPGMYLLRDDYNTVAAFTMGCVVSRGALFEAFNAWALSQVGGARARFGWCGALGALSATRVVEGTFRQEHSPFAGAFVSLVCEYLDDLAEHGESAIQSEFARVKAAFDEHHSAAHAANPTDPWDRETWDRVCWHATIAAAPLVRYSPDPAQPWAGLEPPGL